VIHTKQCSFSVGSHSQLYSSWLTSSFQSNIDDQQLSDAIVPKCAYQLNIVYLSLRTFA